jgi:hypothetical protein
LGILTTFRHVVAVITRIVGFVEGEKMKTGECMPVHDDDVFKPIEESQEA